MSAKSAVDAVEQILADPLGSLRQIVWDRRLQPVDGRVGGAGQRGRSVRQRAARPHRAAVRGHAAAERSLAQRTGITDVRENVGFVLLWQGDNTVQIRWNSGSINARNFGDRAAPQQHRQAIIDAVARTTGAVVVE